MRARENRVFQLGVTTKLANEPESREFQKGSGSSVCPAGGPATHRHAFVMEMTTQSAGFLSSCTIL